MLIRGWDCETAWDAVSLVENTEWEDDVEAMSVGMAAWGVA